MKYSPYRAYKAPKKAKTGAPSAQQAKQPRRRRTFKPKPVAILIFLCLIITVVSVSLALIVPAVNNWNEDNQPPVTPFLIEGNVVGIFASPFSLYNDEMTKEEQQFVTINLLDYCTVNGINTIFLQTKSGESVAYDDRNFESAFDKFDPLELISIAAAERGIATVAVMDLYGADGMNFDAAVTQGRYDAGDVEYAEMLTESLSRLFQHYPVASVVLDNISEKETSALQGLFSGLEQQLAGRTVGLLSELSSPPEFVDFVIADAETAKTIEPQSPSASIYLTAGESSTAQFSFDLFMLASLPQLGGTLVGDYDDVDSQTISMLAASATPQPSDLVPDYQPTPELSLTHPASGELRQTSQNCYIMGLSDPSQPLLMNGVEVVRNGTSGLFGVLVPLSFGDNEFVFTQGDKTVTANIEQYTYSGSGSSVTRDDTVAAAQGTFVEVNVPIASALFDPSSDSNISETLRQGARFLVVNSQLVTRGTTSTYAYQLNSGDWVMAYNTTPVQGDQSVECSGLSLLPSENGELINFDGMNAIAAYDERLGNRLTIEMHGVNFTAAQSSVEQLAITSKLIDTAELAIEGNVTTLTLDLSSQNPVWGHYIEYVEGGMSIELIEAPQQPTGLPLEGFTIMVDAGHGGEDSGAPGIAAGISAPDEKTLNLVLAKVIELRLEQLGAEVIMTRTDDSTVSLQERLIASVTEKPHFFISIHHNSINLVADGNTAAGVEGYYFEETSQPFAAALTEHVAGYTERAARGDFYNYFYVTRSTGAYSVLFEYGFVINPLEYEDLYSEEGIYAAAYGTGQGFVDAVEQFYNSHSTANSAG